MKIIYSIIIYSLLLISNSYAENAFMIHSLEEAMTLSKTTGMDVLVISGAEWCGHCKELKNDIKNNILEKQLTKYIICYIDIEKNNTIKNEFGIKSVPDSRIFVNQKEKDKIIGYNKTKYKQWLLQSNK